MNPDYFREYNKRWRRDNAQYIKEYAANKRKQYRHEWIAYFERVYGALPKCQLCEKQLFWSHVRHDFTVCLDHRTGREVIRSRSPRTWIQNKPCIPENILIFESCNFGVLCRACNLLMPSDMERRKKIAKNLLKYLEESVV